MWVEFLWFFIPTDARYKFRLHDLNYVIYNSPLGVYFVTERCLDGWYKGKNWAEKCGVFPGNYVTPLRYRDQVHFKYRINVFVTYEPYLNIFSNNSSINGKQRKIHYIPLKQHLLRYNN